MCKQPDLSVILPAYNVAPYIEKSIRSLLRQTGIHLEIIVVNDGSTDATLKVVQEKFSDLKNLTLIDQKNQGSGPARNKGLKLAQGKYVLFMDPDDALLPDTLKNLFSKLEPLEPELVIFGLKIYREATGQIEEIPVLLPEKVYQQNAALQADLYAHHRQMTYTPPWNKLIRRDFLLQSGLQFTDQRTGQDVLFNIALFNLVQTAFWGPKPYYLYTLGRKTGAAHQRNAKMAFDNANIAEKLLENAQDEGRQKIAAELIVSFGMRELRHCSLDSTDFSTFRAYFKASPLRTALKQVAFRQLLGMRRLQYLTRTNVFLAYLYYKRNL